MTVLVLPLPVAMTSKRLVAIARAKAVTDRLDGGFLIPAPGNALVHGDVVKACPQGLQVG